MPNNKLTSSQFKPRTRCRHAPRPAKSSIGWDQVAPEDSFSSYMQHKNRKLRQQFASEFSKSPISHSVHCTSNIFAGVVVWVNGHTNPSRLHIRRVMGQHGGRLETYYTSRVTHVVAANLATATRNRFTNASNTAPRVKLVSPQWITASLANARRLPEADFPVPFIRNPTHSSIKSFFAPSTSQTNKHSTKQPPQPN